MSASIPGTSVRIASSLVSAGAADGVLPASEGVSAPAQDASAATPAFEQGRTLAKIVQGGGGEPKKTASSPVTPLQKAVLFFSAAAAALTAGWLFIRGKATSGEASLQPLSDPRVEEMAALKAKIFDATHLERYPHPLRSNVIGEWMTLGDEDKLVVLRREFDLRGSDLNPLPMVPPSAWAAKVAALLERETALKATADANGQGVSSSDKERHQQTLAAANGMREIGEKFAELHIYGLATKAFMDAGELYDALGPRELGQIAVAGAYRSASFYAGLAGETGTADVAGRKAELVQIRTRLYEQFASFKPDLLPKGADPKVAAELVAGYVVGDRALRDRMIEYRKVTKLPGNEYPFPTLKEGWADAVRDLLGELDIGSGTDGRAQKPQEKPTASADAVAPVSAEAFALRVFGAGRQAGAEVDGLFEATLREWRALSSGERASIAGAATLTKEAFILFKGELFPSAWVLERMHALARGDLAESPKGARTSEKQAKQEEGRKALEKMDAKK